MVTTPSSFEIILPLARDFQHTPRRDPMLCLMLRWLLRLGDERSFRYLRRAKFPKIEMKRGKQKRREPPLRRGNNIFTLTVNICFSKQLTVLSNRSSETGATTLHTARCPPFSFVVFTVSARKKVPIAADFVETSAVGERRVCTSWSVFVQSASDQPQQLLRSRPANSQTPPIRTIPTPTWDGLRFSSSSEGLPPLSHSAVYLERQRE